jgi:hypothetical protein
VTILANLQHDSTPPELEKLNQALGQILVTDAIDDVLLQKIIAQRADLVESLLKTIATDEETRRCFAENELVVNNFIIETVSAQRSITKTELAKVSKASKAIKKYKQI